MTAVIIFCILCSLLFLGKIARLLVPLFQKLYLPSSVIGGLIGLAIFSIFQAQIPAQWLSIMGKLPGFLINIIFATLFLGAISPKLGTIFRLALPQLCMGQLMAWGQYLLGLGIIGFIFVPLFGTIPAFGNLLEIGFEGGHGTVGGMAETFRAFDWEDGIALGYTMATVGMILGIVVGMMLINWALHRNYITQVVSFAQRNRHEQLGIYRFYRGPDAGRQTVFSDSIDSLAWHLALIGLAVLVGYLMLIGFQHAEVALLPQVKTRIFNGFPLFPLCMIGGAIVQILIARFRMAPLISRGQMQRISGAALDFLIVSAVATIKLSVVLHHWLPLLALSVAGLLWGVFMVIFVAPRLFPKAWFECAIAEFGQALGVTATGLMLLRTVDPENHTPAATAFGYKQLFHEPFMGGGIWTALALTLVFTIGWKAVFGFSAVMFALWLMVALIIVRRRPKAAAK